MNIKLDQAVRTLLQEKKGDWQAISVAAEVSYSWLSKFVNGHISNPGYATLTRLYAILKPELAQATANQGQAATETVAQGA